MTKKGSVKVLVLLANVVNGVSHGSQWYYTQRLELLIQYLALFVNNQQLDLVAKSSLVVIPKILSDLPQIGH